MKFGTAPVNLSGASPGMRSSLVPGAIPGMPEPTPQQKADIEVDAANRKAYDLRPGGMHVDPVTHDVVKIPELKTTVDSHGNEVPMHVLPASPFAPPRTPGTAEPVMGGTTGNPVISKLAPQMQAARGEAMKDFVGKDTDSFVAA